MTVTEPTYEDRLRLRAALIELILVHGYEVVDKVVRDMEPSPVDR